MQTGRVFSYLSGSFHGVEYPGHSHGVTVRIRRRTGDLFTPQALDKHTILTLYQT